MQELVKVFVSYANQDRALVEPLVKDLEAAGAKVWWDVSGIGEGDFLDRINDALAQCQWLVLALTPNAIASTWVKKEVNAAILRCEQKTMKGILPVLVAPTDLNTLPPLWANLHRYDAVRDYKREMSRLLQTLHLRAVQQHRDPPPPIPLWGTDDPFGRELLLTQVQRQWREILAECQRESALTTATFTPAHPVEIEDGTIPTLVIELGGLFGSDVRDDLNVQEFVARAVTKVVKRPMKVRFAGQNSSGPRA